MSEESSIQVGVVGGNVWVRVAGRGSFQNSAGLKDFASSMVRQGNEHFIVDLAKCEMMDSTFMGTLAGIALKLGENGSFKIIRANERNRQTLENLGLDRIFSVEGEDADHALPEGMMTPPPDVATQAEKREVIIEAHENLVTANPDNAVHFKDVIEFLKNKEPEG